MILISTFSGRAPALCEMVYASQTPYNASISLFLPHFCPLTFANSSLRILSILVHQFVRMKGHSLQQLRKVLTRIIVVPALLPQMRRSALLPRLHFALFRSPIYGTPISTTLRPPLLFLAPWSRDRAYHRRGSPQTHRPPPAPRQAFVGL